MLLPLKYKQHWNKNCRSSLVLTSSWRITLNNRYTHIAYIIIGSPWKDNSLCMYTYNSYVKYKWKFPILCLILKIMNFRVVGNSHPGIRKALKEASLPNRWYHYYAKYPEKKKQTNPDISYQKTPTVFDEYWWIPTQVFSLWGVAYCPCWGCQHLLYKFLINNLLKWGTGKKDSHLVKGSTYTLLSQKKVLSTLKKQILSRYSFLGEILGNTERWQLGNVHCSCGSKPVKWGSPYSELR